MEGCEFQCKDCMRLGRMNTSRKNEILKMKWEGFLEGFLKKVSVDMRKVKNGNF